MTHDWTWLKELVEKSSVVIAVGSMVATSIATVLSWRSHIYFHKKANESMVSINASVADKDVKQAILVFLRDYVGNANPANASPSENEESSRTVK